MGVEGEGGRRDFLIKSSYRETSLQETEKEQRKKTGWKQA